MSGSPVFVPGLCVIRGRSYESLRKKQANLTFTLLFTLKMTAAKAVETSVTSTNSLSQKLR